MLQAIFTAMLVLTYIPARRHQKEASARIGSATTINSWLCQEGAQYLYYEYTQDGTHQVIAAFTHGKDWRKEAGRCATNAEMLQEPDFYIILPHLEENVAFLTVNKGDWESANSWAYQDCHAHAQVYLSGSDWDPETKAKRDLDMASTIELLEASLAAVNAPPEVRSPCSWHAHEPVVPVLFGGGACVRSLAGACGTCCSFHGLQYISDCSALLQP